MTPDSSPSLKPPLIVGMGVQGQKRCAQFRGGHFLTADTALSGVDYRSLGEVPKNAYDDVFLCTPDSEKQQLLFELISMGKNVLVEKPLQLSAEEYQELIGLQRVSGSTVYVAYNHRFEPQIVELKNIINSGELGQVYTISMSYGNGTAGQVRKSPWRDAGLGVIADLGSHLLDLVIFLDSLADRQISFMDAQRIENEAFDHAVWGLSGYPKVYLQTSLLSWKNSFHCEIVASEGSASVSGLCKWGPSLLHIDYRRRPSGRPDQREKTLVLDDPTWAAELAHFSKLISQQEPGNIEDSRQISKILDEVTAP